jgi:hypothetical protein
MNYPTMTEFGVTTAPAAYPFLNEAEFDNMLVAQKDAIFQLINNGQTIAAQAALDVVTPMWNIFTYDYKVREVQARINASQVETGFRQ